MFNDIINGVRNVLENFSGKVADATKTAAETTEAKIMNRDASNTTSKSYKIADNTTGGNNLVKIFYDNESGAPVGAMEFFGDGSSRAYTSPESLDRYFKKIKNTPNNITIYDSPMPLSAISPVPTGYYDDEYRERAAAYYDSGLGDWDPYAVFNLNYRPAYGFGTRDAKRFNRTEGEALDYAKLLGEELLKWGAQDNTLNVGGVRQDNPALSAAKINGNGLGSGAEVLADSLSGPAKFFDDAGKNIRGYFDGLGRWFNRAYNPGHGKIESKDNDFFGKDSKNYADANTVVDFDFIVPYYVVRTSEDNPRTYDQVVEIMIGYKDGKIASAIVDNDYAYGRENLKDFFKRNFDYDREYTVLDDDGDIHWRLNRFDASKLFKMPKNPKGKIEVQIDDSEAYI